MANLKIPFRGLVIFVCMLVSASAKSQEDVKLVLDNLVNIDNKSTTKNDCPNCLFIIVTERVCAGCFKDVSRYAKEQQIDSVYAIDFREKDLMQMLSRYGRLKEWIVDANDIFFLWTDKVTGDFITAITSQPSPQMVVCKKGNQIYHSYKETIRLTK